MMDVESILREIINLLDDPELGALDWRNHFARLADEYTSDPNETKRKIRRLYGGMGSFNDLVFSGPDRKPLQAENDDLDQLRKQLYEACMPYRRNKKGEPTTY